MKRCVVGVRGVAARTAVAVCCACGVAGAQPCAGVSDQTEVAAFFAEAASRRVDIALIGDSNQAFEGNGWDHGWIAAAAQRYGLYATSALSAGENQGNGSGLGFNFFGFSTGSAGVFQYGGAPAALDVFMSSTSAVHPQYYLYRASGATGAFINHGLFLERASPVSVDAALRFHLTYGTFPATPGGAEGAFQPHVRLAETPFSGLVTGPVISTSGAGFGVARTSLDLPAAARGRALNFRFTPNTTNFTAPFLAYFMRAEDLGRASGVSVHTMYALGSMSARDMALALRSAPDQAIDLYLDEVTRLQNGPRTLLVRINSGLNDRNETEPSLGPAMVADGDSPEAFADNLRAIIDRLSGRWTALGFDPGRLYFVASVSHPVDDPDDAELLAYREAAAGLGAELPRLAVTRFDALTNEVEMLASGWYWMNGNDRNHLAVAGFEELSRRELAAMAPLELAGDADASGAVDFDDLTAVLANFGGCDALAQPGDANGDRRVDFDDLTTVLANFGAGR